MNAAQNMLQDCAIICEQETFTLPDHWINGIRMTENTLKQLTHSYMARYMLSIARTPEDRANLDWSSILSHFEKHWSIRGWVPGYIYSDYLYKRYQEHYNNRWVSPMPAFLAAEMDLLKAEALLRMGNAEGAAELINKTRVGRGQLPPADASNIGDVGDPRDAHGSLWAMLKYEKGIECYASAVGLAYFDRRVWGELAEGSPLHFPIPGSELLLLDLTE